jgi:hypothetical protein
MGHTVKKIFLKFKQQKKKNSSFTKEKSLVGLTQGSIKRRNNGLGSLIKSVEEKDITETEIARKQCLDDLMSTNEC